MRLPLATALSIVALLSVAGSALASDVTAESRIGAVTVFPSGAEVTRTAKVKLEGGDHTLIFADLPASAIAGSIRVEGKGTGKLQIGSVDTRRLFVPRGEALATEAERKKLEDELEKIRDARLTLDGIVQAATTQRKLVENLTTLPSRPAPSQGAEKPENWSDVLATIASGAMNSSKLIVETTAKLRETDRQIKELEKKIASLAPAREERTEVKVYVAAGAALEADMVVRYQVPNASWQPSYDARLATGTKAAAPKLDLTRRAAIQQRTGEAWTDVAISLSTTRPSAGTSAPELRPITVDYEPEMRPMAAAAPPAPVARSIAPQMAGGEKAKSEEALADADAMTARKANRRLEVAEQVQAAVDLGSFQAIFGVPGKVSVPATGEAKRVTLMEESIEPALLVRTTPKLDPRAFLYAKLNMPKGAAILPGSVSIFRDGTFVGTGRLPQLAPGEEHELGFGADDAIKVKYAIVDEKRGESGLISSAKTDIRSFRISVKNMHDRALALSVLDQIPASQNQDIRVEMTGKSQPTKKDVEDKRGVVAFDSQIAPDEEKLIEFGYKVTWPAAKGVVYR
jgi:uncharacterized protein (TIGR02231 family)